MSEKDSKLVTFNFNVHRNKHFSAATLSVRNMDTKKIQIQRFSRHPVDTGYSIVLARTCFIIK